MSETVKIVGINLVILLVYSIWLSSSEDVSGKAIGLAFLMSLQVLVNFGASLLYFDDKNKVKGKAFLLATGVVLLIGFSTCFGGGH